MWEGFAVYAVPITVVILSCFTFSPCFQGDWLSKRLLSQLLEYVLDLEPVAGTCCITAVQKLALYSGKSCDCSNWILSFMFAGYVSCTLR